MRVVVVVALLFLSGCAGDKLALAPPPGVDLSGHWRLNEADSDDPLRLFQSQAADSSKSVTDPSQGAPGGRGSRQGRGAGNFGNTGPLGPSIPGVDLLGEGLRWPGKDLDIKQAAGAVTIASAGVSRVFKPGSGRKHGQHKPDDDDANDRDMPARDRGEPPAVCGWEEKTLVVQGGDPDEDRPAFEERYSLSDDGRRLIEIVSFRGGRSNGFTASRVWDRVVPGASAPAAPPAPTPPGPSTAGPAAQ